MGSESYGASASVVVRYDGPIDQLAAILARCLGVNEILVEPSEDPPYELVGSVEVMGMEIWLNTTAPNEYCVKMETTNSHEEVFAGRMHDLSMWLSRLIQTACDLESIPSEVTSG